MEGVGRVTEGAWDTGGECSLGHGWRVEKTKGARAGLAGGDGRGREKEPVTGGKCPHYYY